MKRILMLCCAVLLLGQTMAFAHEMPDEEMRLGGIAAGDTLGYVKMIFGDPSSKNGFDSTDYHMMLYMYSPTFMVEGLTPKTNPLSEQEMCVCNIILKDNSLMTPSGISVGTAYENVFAMFGKSSRESHIRGTNSYYYNGNGKYIAFIVDDKGIITSIVVAGN